MAMLQTISSRTARMGDSFSAIDSLAAGAIVGQVIAKDTHGTVIGAAVGAVTGGVSAPATKARDVRLPEGNHLIVTLTQPLTVSGG